MLPLHCASGGTRTRTDLSAQGILHTTIVFTTRNIQITRPHSAVSLHSNATCQFMYHRTLWNAFRGLTTATELSVTLSVRVLYCLLAILKSCKVFFSTLTPRIFAIYSRVKYRIQIYFNLGSSCISSLHTVYSITACRMKVIKGHAQPIPHGTNWINIGSVLTCTNRTLHLSVSYRVSDLILCLVFTELGRFYIQGFPQCNPLLCLAKSPSCLPFHHQGIIFKELLSWILDCKDTPFFSIFQKRGTFYQENYSVTSG